MKILLIGHGRMGTLLEETARARGMEVVAALCSKSLDRLASLGKAADVVVDFSSPGAFQAVAAYVRRTGTALVSGTTGYDQAQLAAIRALGEAAPVIHSANYSLGVAVFRRLLAQVPVFFRDACDIEVTEMHHNRKADAPSGTAKLLVQALDPEGRLTPVYGREGQTGARRKDEIGIHALRGGTVSGDHTVYFFGEDEVLEITHRAASRQIFVNGALGAAQALVGKPNGFYTLEQLLFGEGGCV
ncbi:MAG TPA: 4-hydroxy-tetrahydrodipicolinate reductase [Oscillospiraceae bacterium]|nr:4-hydroxy-tetrahydrodipicolinate reductase [Oscillospiraceae bacterium]